MSISRYKKMIIVHNFNFSLAFGASMDWFWWDGYSGYFISFHQNHLLHIWSESAVIFPTTRLASVCLSLVEWEHNSRLFKNQESSFYELLEKVKSYSLWWLKAKKTNFILGIQMWWSNRLMCLDTSWAEEIALVLLI